MAEIEHSKRKDFVKVLRGFAKKNKPITIIIKSGQNCCRFTGCIGEIVGVEYITLITSNGVCVRTYIRIDCICAVKDEVEEVKDFKGFKDIEDVEDVEDEKDEWWHDM
ncbi:hypothetical protein MWH28_06745 [Natroniella sulfidigena]|uniref:hypothetical protein n=1 Tax=Natroniella sulfidigena TaxID=723921 RepID=UPI00200B41EF|nr:hypothetical protein [Natroniella sulfidigena]MCK8817070.1 hypothetical protein [Natroniella sulfidigena]